MLAVAASETVKNSGPAGAPIGTRYSTVRACSMPLSPTNETRSRTVSPGRTSRRDAATESMVHSRFWSKASTASETFSSFIASNPLCIT